MGLPEITITFKKAAGTAIARSGKGTVAVLLTDNTIEGAAPVRYGKMSEVSADHWTSDNYALIKTVFDGAPGAVLAVRVTTIADALQSIVNDKWDWVCSAITDSAGDIVTFISTQRQAGKTFKAVVAGATAPNCEGVVNFTTTGIKVFGSGEAKDVTGEEYTLRIAGILAGLDMGRSATYYILPEVSAITPSATPDADVDAGKLIIVYDGTGYKLGRAVTSLTASSAVSSEFKKIKAVAGADMISKDISAVFASSYIGQVANDYDNKQVLVSAINSYLASLEGTVLDGSYENIAQVSYSGNMEYLAGAGVDTSEYTEAQVLMAGTGSSVILDLYIKLLDAMEDLKLTVNLS